MSDISVFNSLTTLSEANERLKRRLAVLGDRADLAELKDILDRFDLAERVGITLLHKHFSINEGERVVEFGHVSTPWPVPASGKVAGGYVVPRSWRFINHAIEPYEFGFSHPGQEDYQDLELPREFIDELESFLSKTNLSDVLGICAIGASEIEGRIEKNQGRVNFTIPANSPRDLDITQVPEHSPSVWSFDCKSGLNDATIKLARVCWVCPKH